MKHTYLLNSWRTNFFAPLTACLMTRSIEWVTHPFSPVHFGWQKAHCYAKIRKCFGAKTPGITNYSAIMPKSGTCTSLLQPQSYMENLNAASKELWTPLGNNLLLKGKLLFEKLDHHASCSKRSQIPTWIHWSQGHITLLIHNRNIPTRS